MLFDGDVTFINEEFHCDNVRPGELDELLAEGWRHFGTQFFRYSLGVHEFDIRRVIPLRINLDRFSLSKSQRRVLNRNIDVSVDIQATKIKDDAQRLFDRHKRRFSFGVPDSIFDFISREPDRVPCEGREVTVRLDGRLIAASYFDVGERSVSAVYGMFDPDFPRRSLGILTMLKEIEFASVAGKEYYYQGYSYDGPSFYDYKKRFRGTESFDWNGNWKPFSAIEELTADNTDNADKS